MISILTATYNRAHLLPRLYESLLNQSDQNFEWIIVDDGSTDNTQEVVSKFMMEGLFSIRSIYRHNGGKHRAINCSVKEAKGELCFIVDSDDILCGNAIELIHNYWNTIPDHHLFAGVVGLKAYFDSRIIGSSSDKIPHILDTDMLSYRTRYRVKGDRAEIFRTEVLKEYTFPEIEGEFFCPEALVWNRISQKYKMRYFNETIYLCEYLPDGLTAKIIKLRCENTVASLSYYKELSTYDIPLTEQLKAYINYWRFAFSSKRDIGSLLKEISPYSLFMFPFGYYMHLKDKYVS
ncbi:MAG: glycosyltransferase family A protein [Bacteroidales bacterium]